MTQKEIDQLPDNVRKYIISLKNEIDRALGAGRIVEIFPKDMEKLRNFIKYPNGSLTLNRVSFDAVEHGGLLIRSQCFKM